MFRNIMVPVDGTSFSREAVLQGLRLASLYGGTLRLVRVASARSLSAGGEAIGSDSALGVHAAQLADLYAIAAECRAHSTINVTASLERGPIVDALCGYARRNGVDLIVMRSHGRSGVARIWFGSVADSLIRETGVPVLVVGPPSVGTAIERGFSHRKILVPLDGSVLAEQALPPAVSIARIEGAIIFLTMVVAPRASADHGALLSAIGPAAEQDVSAAQSYLDRIVRQYAGGMKMFTSVVVSSNASASILHSAESEEVDLITMATRGQGMMARSMSGGSVSDQVMRESATSTLVIHPILRAETPGERAAIREAALV
jgi:nucleotide-binding universal stress UspA family protein